MRTSVSTSGTSVPVFATGSILRHVLVMTATGALGLVSIFIAELIEMLLLSTLGDVAVVAAVGYASPLLFITMSIAIGLSVATVALVSPALGAGDRARARRLSASVHVFTLAASTASCLAFLPFVPWLLDLLGAEGRTADLALAYLLILVPSLPPLALALTSSAVLRSLGDAKRAMHVTLAFAIVTVALDLVLIFGLGLGLYGAAIASVVARVVIMLVALHALVRVHDMIAWPKLANCRTDLRPVLGIALPALATNLATPIANTIVTGTIATFGDEAVAGWAVILRVQPVMFGFVFAMSGSVGPIIGQNLGAGHYARMRATFTTALQVVVLYTLAAWLVLVISAPHLVVWFKAKGATADLILLYCYWLAPAFGFQGALFVANAVFNTLRRPKTATVINWARAILGTWPFTAAGAAMFGASGVLAGNLLGGVVFGCLAIFLALRWIEQFSANQVHFRHRRISRAGPLARPATQASMPLDGRAGERDGTN